MRGFVRDFEATRTEWQDRLRAARADGRRTVLWGGGSKGVSFLTTLGLQAEVDYVVDVNPFKQDKFMAGTGHEVSSPERLRGREAGPRRGHEPDLPDGDRCRSAGTRRDRRTRRRVRNLSS